MWKRQDGTGDTHKAVTNVNTKSARVCEFIFTSPESVFVFTSLASESSRLPSHPFPTSHVRVLSTHCSVENFLRMLCLAMYEGSRLVSGPHTGNSIDPGSSN